MAETVGHFISPFIGEPLQQLDEDENAGITVPDISLFNDSLENSQQAKTSGFTGEHGSTAVAEGGAELDDSLCLEEENMQSASVAETEGREMEIVVPQDDLPSNGDKADATVALGGNSSTKNTTSGDHLNAKRGSNRRCVATSSGRVDSKSPTRVAASDSAGSQHKMVPTFGKRKKDFTPPEAQARTSELQISHARGPTNAKQSPIGRTPNSTPLQTDSSTQEQQVTLEQGSDIENRAETNGESMVPSATTQPQKPMFGPPKHKTASKPKTTTNKGGDRAKEETSGLAVKKKASTKAEREAKKREKEQQKLEREKKRAERERLKEEKRLEQERKKAEREQKKMEKELKKIEREQKKAQKETSGPKKGTQSKSTKGSVGHLDEINSNPLCCLNESDSSSKRMTTKSLADAPPGPDLCTPRERSPEMNDAGKEGASDAEQLQTHSHRNSALNTSAKEELTPPEPNLCQSDTTQDVEHTEKTATGHVPKKHAPETKLREEQEPKFSCGGGISPVKEVHPNDFTDTEINDGSTDEHSGVTSVKNRPDVTLSETKAKENVKPSGLQQNHCIDAKTPSPAHPIGKDARQENVQEPQVKNASRKPTASSKKPSNKLAPSRKPIHRSKALGSKPSKPEKKNRPPSLKPGKRKAVEPSSSGSEGHMSNPESAEPPRKKHRRSTPANYSGPVWAQCGRPKCQKWRQLKDCRDPSEVPNKWECSMNTDPGFNSCSIPEEQWSDLGDSQEYVESPFIPGSIVWARMGGYPWWPAMVEEDPDEETYYETSDTYCSIPVKYHVVFFDTPVCRGWIPSGLTLNFDGVADINEVKKVNVPKKYKQSLKLGVKLAEKALTMAVKERLAQFTFSKRYRKTAASRKRAAKGAVDEQSSGQSTSLEAPKPGSRKSARLRTTSTEPETVDNALTPNKGHVSFQEGLSTDQSSNDQDTE